ncbi:50S ribosomal subunit protein L24 [Desulfamplus magnetovallimortis]|uniref:Large ribosomal subunit protein uL24 n=1 Tax=Desulfamplus magnetovallimortis TaxID=1246637 RepID=A0A1W1H5L6_9BACT|nr:50S ribosomal protein L24 [Desulfamplus magnetovallimortis]SLM27769.1 50S ribosomal subunit protein L24 [Desulfamplus magnetovallimortis]
MQSKGAVNTKLKKDDKVQVIAGKDKGKIGKVMKVLKKKNRAVVENINIAKVHERPTQANPQGGITEKPMPIEYSNIMIMCNHCMKPTRVGMKILENNKKVRFCKKCNEQIDA